MLATTVETAASFSSRLLGLMGRKSMKHDSAMLLRPCNSIHTCFMRFDIDVVFLDKDNKVVYLREEMKPWRMTPLIISAKSVLELPGGTLKSRVALGDELEFNG
ncbi:DUF192 domain-containing protein [Parelusimicrobium proximum]|uniref:DUF192 domain-containing protein n=1 Tax=Parelusimicrobium proximum TaxID=3228953 RepID=UPI003D16E7E0